MQGIASPGNCLIHAPPQETSGAVNRKYSTKTCGQPVSQELVLSRSRGVRDMEVGIKRLEARGGPPSNPRSGH